MPDGSTEIQDIQEQREVALDWFLQNLVDLADISDDVEIGMTLQVSGFLVSGVMVSGAKYFQGFAEEFTSVVLDQTLKQRLQEYFLRCFEDGDDGAGTPLPVFIHLKGARFFNTNGKPIPANRRGWWRGRISQVGGFTLGTLGDGT